MWVFTKEIRINLMSESFWAATVTCLCAHHQTEYFNRALSQLCVTPQTLCVSLTGGNQHFLSQLLPQDLWHGAGEQTGSSSSRSKPSESTGDDAGTCGQSQPLLTAVGQHLVRHSHSWTLPCSDCSAGSWFCTRAKPGWVFTLTVSNLLYEVKVHRFLFFSLSWLRYFD